MRFAFKTFQHSTSWTDLLETWRAADQMEIFESGWIFDHYYRVVPGPNETAELDRTSPCFETWTTLAALAAATRRLRLGVIVTGVVNHNVGILAKMAATVDHICDGRLELSLGAGSMEEEKHAYGLTLGSPKERMDRLEEVIPAIVSLFTQETTTFEGTYVQLRDARLVPKPVQQPYPPITIGGIGRRRTLRIAAEWAQHWNTAGTNPVEFGRRCGVLDDWCAKLGREPKQITRSAQLFVMPDDDPRRIAAQAPAYFDAGADVVVFGVEAPFSARRLEQIADAASALG